MNVAALYVDPAGPYPDLVSTWFDAAKDARNYLGPHPVVAHPPCRSWSRMRHFAKAPPGERELGLLAVQQVRRFGGVLEHPIGSQLWVAAGLPQPGRRDAFGFCLAVDQFWFGHRAQKRTLLYVVGCQPADLPVMPIQLGEAPCILDTSSRAMRTRKYVTKRERHLSPVGFATWLIESASRCKAAGL